MSTVSRASERSLSQLSRASRLLWALTVRDFKGQYRRSVLGPGWAILQPLIYMVIFVFIRSALGFSSEGVAYPIFTFAALVPWMFFSNSVSRSALSVYGNAQLIKKMAIWREVFPLAAVAVSSVDLFLSGLILAGLMVWYGVELSSIALLWLPLLVTILVALTVGVGLFVAAIGAYRRDVQFGVPFLLNFGLLITPVMYPLSEVPDSQRTLYALNPMVGIIEGFRSVLVKAATPEVALLGISLVGTVVVWAVAWPLFRSLSQYFADVL